jgi:hypothetical protein
MAMIRTIALTILVLAACSPQNDADRPHDIRAWGFGTTNSCAQWLETAQSRALGNEWVLAYWTGQNVRNARDHEVGRSTDANGVLSAVEAACRDDLDERLASAAGRVYVNFERERR